MRAPFGSCLPLFGRTTFCRRASADESAGAAGRRSGADARCAAAPRPRRRRSAADVPPDRPDRGDRAERGPRCSGAGSGSSYRPEDLKRELEEKRTLFELDAMVRPMSDVGLYLASAEEWTDYDKPRDWMTANDKFRRDILKLLRRSGPLASREIPDTCVVPWASTGWTNDRNVTQMLEYMAVRGEIAIAGRIGRERVWDLAERVYPKVKVPSVEEAERQKNERRLAALGIARAKRPKMPMEPAYVGDAGEPAVVEGDEGRVASRSVSAGRRIQGPYRAPLAVRPADPRPRARRGALRLRVHARDVQARGAAALGLLRAADPPRRPARREARREGRPQGRGAARERDPRGREVHEARSRRRCRRRSTDLASWLELEVEST